MVKLNEPKRVCIVGGGASGMSAAYALSKHPERFVVTLMERSASPGGMATSAPIDPKYGADFINDGVQGASPVFHNTYAIFDILGFKAAKVGMQVSFGRDQETEFWSNVFPSKVIDNFHDDIKKFGKVLEIIQVLEPLFVVISVQRMLSLFRFSKDFGDVMVFPLVALFFGTGNQTPYISSVIMARVFNDPNMRLFEYSPTSFLASIPEMRAFPRLSLLYAAWKDKVESTGNVTVKLQREVTAGVRSKSGVRVTSRATQGTNNDQQVVEPGEAETFEDFDEIIMATDADAALKILGKGATWMEKKVLGNVKYLWDVTVTHNDVGYMDKYYRVAYSPELRSQNRKDDSDAQEQFKYAENHFQPLYYIRSYPSDKSKVEMSFDLTNYQPQFKDVPPQGPSSSTESLDGDKAPPMKYHVFQTIFLDQAGSEDLWSRGEIDKDKVLLEKWWKQQSHRWQHYSGTVPWMMFINGKNRTHFAGAWTILNMHEIAVASGFAAAYQLGAEYPFNDKDECRRMFALCLGANHGSRMRSEDRKGFLM